MIRILLLVLALLPVIANAAPVTVQSGEHDGFTRLVFDYREPVDWQVGRTTDGYELRASNRSGYDFTQVFDLIGKGRLAAIWADPQSGAVRVGIACACHAIPFEFRPGIIVVDLRDGAPPKGSSFEIALDGSAAPDLSTRPEPRPRPRPETAATYDWLSVPLDDSQVEDTPMPARLPDLEPSLEPLREALLRQLSRGAAQGLVDMAIPKAGRGSASGNGSPSVQIRVGDLPGVESATPDQTNPISAAGLQCPSSASLDIATWGSDSPISEQLANSATGLIGEFDKPDPEAVARAVKFRIFAGFGAEARQMLQAFPIDLPDALLWRSLSYLVDGETETGGHFAGMAACDSPAALWALIADRSEASHANRKAVLIAFSALPAHLRQVLGPDLAGLFLDSGDPESARAIKDAITRAPGSASSAVTMLEAEMLLKSGDPQAAEAELKAILADPGPTTSEALIAYVEARFAQSLPVNANVVPALEAIVLELAETDTRPNAVRALALAQASSGDFPAAFATTHDLPEVSQDVWQILAIQGTDSAVLSHAVRDETDTYPALKPDITETLVTRLLDLGFSRQAANWLDTLSSPSPLLAARVALAKGDPRAALTWLSGASDADAAAIRASALLELGQYSEASMTFAEAGQAEAASVAARLTKDWGSLPEGQPDPWKSAAQFAVPATAPESGPLKRGNDLVETSAATRVAVTDLLKATPRP
jgi:hypothetical protein